MDYEKKSNDKILREKKTALPAVLISALVAMSIVSTVSAAGKGKGKGNNNSTGEITLNVDAHCNIYIDSEKEISNVIYNLGQPNEYKKESYSEDLIGHQIYIGEYNYGEPIIREGYSQIHVKAGNNGERGKGNNGVGDPVWPGDFDGEIPEGCETQAIDWGDCPCQGPGKTWAAALDGTPNQTGDDRTLEVVRDRYFDIDGYEATGYDLIRVDGGRVTVIRLDAVYLPGIDAPGAVFCYNSALNATTERVGNTQAQSIEAVKHCRAGLEALSNTQ